MIKKTKAFVFGDVQGQSNLLEKLLIQEGLIDENFNRLRPEVEVICLGDLIHAGNYSMGFKSITPEDDETCVSFLSQNIIDVMLWGNHDRPVYAKPSERTTFSGYRKPGPVVYDAFDKAWKEGRLKIAYSFGKFLLTHAGLNIQWSEDLPQTPKAIAALLNRVDEKNFGKNRTIDIATEDYVRGFITDIGYIRGGGGQAGGVLWRHNDEQIEPLYKGVRQIFGHTPCVTPEVINTPKGDSYCLDISKSGGVAGIWLPEEKVVCVRD